MFNNYITTKRLRANSVKKRRQQFQCTNSVSKDTDVHKSFCNMEIKKKA